MGIRERLSTVEDDFLVAMSGGIERLEIFQASWAALVSDFDDAVRKQLVDDDLIAFANALASRIQTISGHFLDLSDQSEAITSRLTTELEHIFSEMCLSDVQSSEPHPSLVSHKRGTSLLLTNNFTTEFHGFTPYLHIACNWLQRNLHNPYPSRDVKEMISVEAGSPRKDVDGWFVEARKRIGWNWLRKNCFANKRVDIVDAATRFFVEADPKRPLDPNIELEFATIEDRAKDMYSDKFFESPLAAQLDAVVKDMTPQMKLRAKSLERRRRQQQLAVQSASHYPSPARTPNASPSPSVSSFTLADGESDYDLQLSNPSMSLKRRNSFEISPVIAERSEDTDRPCKRSRLDCLSFDKEDTVPGLPSPAASLHGRDICKISGDVDRPSSPVQFITSRKRRLSFADCPDVLKRPRNFPVEPRLHAVSDPLPLSNTSLTTSAFNDWFNHSLPGMADMAELSASSALDVELFDFATITDNSSTESLLSPSTNILSNMELTADYDANIVPPCVPDEEFDLSSLLDPYYHWPLLGEVQGSHATKDLTNQDDLQTIDFSSFPSDLGLPSSLDNIFASPLHHFQAPGTAIEANSTILLSSGAGAWPEVHSSTSLPIDLGPHISVFNLEKETTLGYNLSPMHSEKAIKQRRLRQMKAETRRLEEELAASC